jgi:hypothetical protein
MNTEHDLIYGSYKIIDAVNQDSSKDVIVVIAESTWSNFNMMTLTLKIGLLFLT